MKGPLSLLLLFQLVSFFLAHSSTSTSSDDLQFVEYGKSLDASSFANWPDLDFSEQVFYLLGPDEMQMFHEEFTAFGNKEEVELSDVEKVFGEFQDPEKITEFFDICDADASASMDINEYILCRGNYDRYGNISEVNEYDYRESELFQDYEDQQREYEAVLTSETIQVDSEGMIID